jgi:hypothetical protein
MSTAKNNARANVLNCAFRCGKPLSSASTSKLELTKAVRYKQNVATSSQSLWFSAKVRDMNPKSSVSRIAEVDMKAMQASLKTLIHTSDFVNAIPTYKV